MPRKRPRSPAAAEDGDTDDELAFDDTQSLPGRSGEPLHRNAANARERARMRVLSKAFCRLKTTLPWVPADTKLSKLDTLRLAASYIAHLKAALRDEPSEAQVPHPLNLAWPFAFQHGGGSGAANVHTSPGKGWSPAGDTAAKGHKDKLHNQEATSNYDCQSVSFVNYDSNETNESNSQYCDRYAYRDCSYYQLRRPYDNGHLTN